MVAMGSTSGGRGIRLWWLGFKAAITRDGNSSRSLAVSLRVMAMCLGAYSFACIALQ
jgi:hypothetical protein